MGQFTHNVCVAPCFVGTLLAMSHVVASASIQPQIRQGDVGQRGHLALVSEDGTNDRSSLLMSTRRLLGSARSLFEYGDDHTHDEHTHGAPVGTHAHEDDEPDHTHAPHTHDDAPAHAHANDTAGHTHAPHSHAGAPAHAHADDEDGHTHAPHSHAGAPAHAHADDQDGHTHTDIPAHSHSADDPDHTHACHTHDGLAPHVHADDDPDHQHTDTEALEPCDLSCTASTLQDFDCMETLLGGDVIFHYQTFQTGDEAARMAIEAPSDAGWASLGFGRGMVGSTAVIATTSAAAGGIGVFTLDGQSSRAINEVTGATEAASGRRLADANGAFTITDASVERADGRLVARFSRPYDDSFTADAPFDAIVAYHSSEAALNSAHTSRADGLALSLTGGGVVVAEDNTPQQRRIHAALMLIGWGILIPLGVIMAASLRTVGPKSMWFQLHRATQSVALLLATIGFFLAIAKFDSLPEGDSHKQLGIVVMVLGWLQPLNALIRPHPPQEGEKRSFLRIAWQFAHRIIAWAAIGLSISTIFRGIKHAETYEGLTENHDAYKRGYIAALVIMLLLYIGGTAFNIVRSRRQCRDNDGKYTKSTPASEMAHVDRHPIDSMRPDSP
eukprot:jgi/Ulvmu1/6984/UM033_0042.1